MAGALSGYRVLDLTDEKGMLCTRLLADMGAGVIRVEKPGSRWGHDSADYCYLNTGKRSITLALEKEAGRDLFRRLIKTSDVLVETGRPGYMSSLGLGFDELSKINTRLVVASLTDFGQDGPYRDYMSSDLVAEALGGWMQVTGGPDTPPLKLAGNQAYYTSSLFAANGILLALWQRHTSGRGQHIDISVMECVAATLDHVLVRYFSEEVVAERHGSRYWNNAFRILTCRDGYVLMTLFQQWETLVEWLDSEGMADDLSEARWKDRQARVEGIDHIIEVLEKWALNHTADELVEKGQLMRFPWAKVTSLPELLSSPQLVARDYFMEMECPGSGGKYQVPGAAFRVGGSPLKPGNRAPEPGEDNAEIYSRELGLPGEQIGALVKEGVI